MTSFFIYFCHSYNTATCHRCQAGVMLSYLPMLVAISPMEHYNTKLCFLVLQNIGDLITAKSSITYCQFHPWQKFTDVICYGHKFWRLLQDSPFKSKKTGFELNKIVTYELTDCICHRQQSISFQFFISMLDSIPYRSIGNYGNYGEV